MLIKTESLTKEAQNIIFNKGTEPPDSLKCEATRPGSYLCRLCGLALFRTQAQFNAHCGWPSFDEEVQGKVTMLPDSDGVRTEIQCGRCHSHLGHVFYGEGFTKKNTRFCVNSLSLDFTENQEVKDTEEGIFAGGCFWGLDYLFSALPGVVLTEVGYTGGHFSHPSYDDVCDGRTGHVEAVRVVFDIERLTFLDLGKYFFEIHDPAQVNGQGPDIGEQYLSVGFYYDEAQKSSLTELIRQLKEKGIEVATKLKPVSTFWPAELYHQRYYEKTKKSPYCHFYLKKF